MNETIGYWANPVWLCGLFLAALLWLVGWRIYWWRQGLWEQLASPRLRTLLGIPPRGRYPRLRLACGCLALAGVFCALADFRWGKVSLELPQPTQQLMFALDVSRSMLAEDVAPNRLTRGRLMLEELMEQLDGERVGLVLFAGEAEAVVPLTRQLEEVRRGLEGAEPNAVHRGGSDLGTALETAANGLLLNTSTRKTIVLITDGEDQTETSTEIARRLAVDHGIRVLAIGLGDEVTGARIPRSENRGGQYMTYQGQEVWTKLNGVSLKQFAEASGGAYLPVGTKRVSMAEVYRRYLADERDLGQPGNETARLERFVPRYAWFLWPALILLILECCLQPWSSSIPTPLAGRGTPR